MPHKVKPIKQKTADKHKQQKPGSYKTEWDMTLFYDSPKDPRIEKDVETIIAAFEAFAKKWNHIKAAELGKPPYTALIAILKDWEALENVVGGWKPVMYFAYLAELDSEDTLAKGQLTTLSNRLTKAANEIVFFGLTLGEIPHEEQKELLAMLAKNTKHPLARFRRLLKVTFDRAAHDLSQKEEKLLNLLSGSLHSDWSSGAEKQLQRATIMWEGKELPVTQAIEMVPGIVDTASRRALHRLAFSKVKEISLFAEAEINSIFNTKKITDELRGYKEPFSATVMAYENEESTARTVVELVRAHYHIAHRFYALKAKMLKEKHLTYADRAASVGSIGKQSVSFNAAVEGFHASLLDFDPDFAKRFNATLKEGRIDAFPRKGKRSGAFCSSVHNCPVMVLLNYQGKARDALTLAHEMGHAFHSELSRTQPIMYQYYSIAAAEVASTFFENIMAKRIAATLQPKDRIIFLHDQLQDSISTVFRQVACFEFELSLHKEIRSTGFASAARIGELHNAAMSSYLGPTVQLTEEDGYFFVNWSHIREFFYVYSYAFGELISRELYSRYQENPAFKENVITFLKAGGSDSPENIFAAAGIDVRNPEFYRNALARIENDLEELERAFRESM